MSVQPGVGKGALIAHQRLEGTDRASDLRGGPGHRSIMHSKDATRQRDVVPKRSEMETHADSGDGRAMSQGE
ncbi:hypothetical protein GCM10010439_34690 [Actinocorallia aurantiaca]|uniref:Uncharacterized protein n=1 Tax=Actinocorallia aurantiaca TaxID=46204 RepID=A0ABP6GPC3_9ACTN